MKFKLGAGYTKFTNIYLIPTVNIFILDGVDISIVFLAWYVTLEAWK